MARHESRAFEFLTGKARPSPLVLDLIKAVLTAPPIPVELRNRAQLIALAPEAGDEHHVLIELDRVVRFIKEAQSLNGLGHSP